MAYKDVGRQGSLIFRSRIPSGNISSSKTIFRIPGNNFGNNFGIISGNNFGKIYFMELNGMHFVGFQEISRQA